jgi:hypothetical protein
MKKRGKLNRLLKNKVIITIILLILIGLIIFIGVKTHKSPIQRKLIGFWNIEYENSYWERDSVCDFIGCIIHIQNNDTIKLPSIHDTIGAIDFQGKTALELDEDFWTDEIIEKGKKHSEKIRKNAIGTWKIISTNPDSVFFNVPKNPLHGKYAIRFFIDENGYKDMNNIYKIELKNDSTYLICNKGGIFYNRDVRNWINK